MRLAVWSPLPPSPSGIADYVAEQVPALQQHAEVRVVTEGAAPPPDDWADLDAVHELAASIFDSTPTPPIDVRRDGDVTGIAIGEPGECLLVRSEPFDVWLPGSIYRSFRDEACVASWATAGALRRAPH